jgi:hypothetical protein
MQDSNLRDFLPQAGRSATGANPIFTLLSASFLPIRGSFLHPAAQSRYVTGSTLQVNDMCSLSRLRQSTFLRLTVVFFVAACAFDNSILPDTSDKSWKKSCELIQKLKFCCLINRSFMS